MAPDETGLLESVEEARRENGGKGAERITPQLAFVQTAGKDPGPSHKSINRFGILRKTY
jgi:hypothetical protein